MVYIFRKRRTSIVNFQVSYIQQKHCQISIGVNQFYSSLNHVYIQIMIINLTVCIPIIYTFMGLCIKHVYTYF